jgi:hypothetical protein
LNECKLKQDELKRLSKEHNNIMTDYRYISIIDRGLQNSLHILRSTQAELDEVNLQKSTEAKKRDYKVQKWSVDLKDKQYNKMPRYRF